MATLDQRIAYASLIAQIALVLKGWGKERDDGKWAAWNANELFDRSVEYANWLLSEAMPEMHPADIGLDPDGRLLAAE